MLEAGKELGHNARVGRTLSDHIHHHPGVRVQGVMVQLGMVRPDPRGQLSTELEVDHPILKLGEDPLLATGVLHFKQFNLFLIRNIEGDEKLSILLLLKGECSSKAQAVVVSLMNLLNHFMLYCGHNACKDFLKNNSCYIRLKILYISLSLSLSVPVGE